MSYELQKYKDIMEKYYCGDFGKEHLTMTEILDKAGESNLFEKMSVSDLEYLIANSFGATKQMFCLIKSKKV